MKKCLMLDVDGVLINGRPQDGKSWAASLEKDLSIDAEQLQEQFFSPYWAEIVTGRMGLTDALDLCLPNLNEGLTAEQFLQYWFENDARIDVAVLEDCAKLREHGAKVFLATNQEHLRARYIMQDLGISAHVDGIVYSADIGVKKPEMAFFQAASNIAATPADCLILVDDTAANIEGAKAAGWEGLLWCGGLSE